MYIFNIYFSKAVNVSKCRSKKNNKKIINLTNISNESKNIILSINLDKNLYNLFTYIQDLKLYDYNC